MRQQVYFETLLLELYCCCEDYVKYGLLQKYLFPRKKQTTKVNDKLLQKNNDFRLLHTIKNIHRSKLSQ